MSVTPTSYNGWSPEGAQTQLPPGGVLPMQASQQAGRGQAIYMDAAGNFALNDGASPGLVCGGVIFDPRITAPSTNAGAALTSVWTGYGSGIAASTIAGDSFLATDFGAVAYDAGNGTPGKLSNYAGSNRSIMGIVFGLSDDGTPRLWIGTAAQIAARSLLLTAAAPLAIHSIADAAANTATAERIVAFRPKTKGTITGATFTGAALVVGDTDYVTVSIAKRDGSGGGAVVLATYDSRAAGNGAVTAFVPKAMTLSVVAGALYLLETDVVTITVVKGGAGQVLTGEFLLNGKAI